MDEGAIVSIVGSLERNPSIIVSLARETPAGVLRRRPRLDKWSAHEHACHVAEVEPIFLARLDLMCRQDHPVLRPYFPDRDTEGGVLLAVDLADALARYQEQRRRLVERLRALAPETWARTAQHREYSCYSVFSMLRHLAIHDMFHAYRIEELVVKRELH